MAQPGFLNASFLVAFGGGAGAWLRYAAGRAIGAGSLPWATLAVNLFGSLLMGLLAGWLTRHGSGGETWRLLLGVGVLGGFTTFSAFSLELALMIERGSMGAAATYVAVSVLAGVAALFAGLVLMRVAA